MAEKTFNQNFNGYWREVNINSIPNESGIYCVYECTHNPINSTVAIHGLLYIGESANVRDRIATHEKKLLWEELLGNGKILCYNFSAVNSNDRERVEAAFIFRHKPPVNIEYKDNFPFDKTIIKSTGKAAMLDDFFVVNTK